jgi:hypothetical protein
MKRLRTLFAIMLSAMALHAAELPQFIVPDHEEEMEALEVHGEGGYYAKPGRGTLQGSETPQTKVSASRSNVLFVIVDDLTTTMSCQRWPGAKTPHLDALAARGVCFEKAYCQFAVCNPARGSFLTGCYPEKTKVMDLQTSFRAALPDIATLPQHFKHHGYVIAAVGKVFHVPDPKALAAGNSTTCAPTPMNSTTLPPSPCRPNA